VDDNEKKLVDKIVNRFKRAESWRQPREEKWKRWYQNYRSYVTEPKADRSNLFIPWSFSVIETLMPRIIEALFATRPYLEAIPQEEKDEATAKAMTQLLDYQCEKIDIVDKFTRHVKEALMYGTAWVKVPWRYETQAKKERKYISLPMGIRVPFGFGTKNIVAWDDPDIELVDICDIYHDPEGTNVDDCEWIIHRVYRTLDDLRRLEKQGTYKNIDQIKDTGSNIDSFRDDRLKSIGFADDDGVENDNNKVELLEYWEDGRVVVVANRSVIIRDEENPFWHGKKPFVATVPVPIPHEFEGVSVLETIEHLQAELNTTRNQRIDNVSLVINRMWLKSEVCHVNPSELVSRPNGIINIQGDIAGLQPLVVPDVTGSAYQEEQVIERNIQEVTGLYDPSRGQALNRKTTATEITSLQDAANYRFRLMIRLIETTGLSKIGDLMVQLNQQYIDRSRVVRITGDSGRKWVKLSPEEIQGAFDIRCAGSSVEPLANKEAKRAQVLQIWQTFGPLSAQDPSLNRYELMKMVFESFDVKNVDRFLKTPEQLQQEQIEAQVQQQAMAQQQAIEQQMQAPPMPIDQIPPEMMGGALIG
jgi:hypothetical protein